MNDDFGEPTLVLEDRVDRAILGEILPPSPPTELHYLLTRKDIPHLRHGETIKVHIRQFDAVMGGADCHRKWWILPLPFRRKDMEGVLRFLRREQEKMVRNFHLPSS